jgi:hypothetical protein
VANLTAELLIIFSCNNGGKLSGCDAGFGKFRLAGATPNRLWFPTILNLKNGTKGKPKIPLDTRLILGYFPAIVTHHSL